MPTDAPKNKRTPAKTVVIESTSVSYAEWSPALIRAAEIAADRGDLRMAADLSEAILVDDRVMGAMEALCSVASLPLTFDPEGPVADALGGPRGDWWAIIPEPQQRRLVKWGQMLGVGLAHINGWNYDATRKRLIPDIEVWHPRNLRYDRRNKQWIARTTDGEVPVTPGDSEWILYLPFGQERPWSIAPWRSLSRWWLLKRYAVTDWGSTSERHGNGTEVVSEKFAELPDGFTSNPGDEEISKQRRAEVLAQLRSLKRNAKLVLPPGFEYKLHESTARTFETFKYQTECANTAFAIALVGQNLSTEVKGGSLAAAEVHQRVESRVIRNVAESIATLAHDQLLNWYGLYNFAGQPTPWPVFDTKPPEDLKASAESLKLVGEALEKIEKAGYDVENVEEFGLKYGVKLKRKPKPDPLSSPPPDGKNQNDDAAA